METNTLIIQLTDEKAIGFLNELEKLQWIKVLQGNVEIHKVPLSQKYKGFISKDEGKDLNEHLKKMRSEWNSI